MHLFRESTVIGLETFKMQKYSRSGYYKTIQAFIKQLIHNSPPPDKITSTNYTFHEIVLVFPYKQRAVIL